MIIEEDGLVWVKWHGACPLFLLCDSFINFFLYQTKTKATVVKWFYWKGLEFSQAPIAAMTRLSDFFNPLTPNDL
jgi:hypothetical protein